MPRRVLITMSDDATPTPVAPVSAALGLGGNLGEPVGQMASALQMLDSDAETSVITVSRVYRTPPWGPVEQPSFMNCCALVETRREPDRLMQLCLDIERDLKRVRDVRWGPRLVDIDILTYGDLTTGDAFVTVPHPRMTERGFVLVPLAEIAPKLRIMDHEVQDWLKDVDSSGIDPASDDGNWWQAPE